MSITTGRDLAEALGLGRTVLRAENNLAALGGVVDPRKALEWSRHGIALARRLGMRSTMISLIVNLVYHSIKAGDWQVARSELEAVLAQEWAPTARLYLLNRWCACCHSAAKA